MKIMKSIMIIRILMATKTLRIIKTIMNTQTTGDPLDSCDYKDYSD